jgi:hypothetical protein
MPSLQDFRMPNMGLGAHKQQLRMLPTEYFEVLEVLSVAFIRLYNTYIVELYLKQMRLPPRLPGLLSGDTIGRPYCYAVEKSQATACS